jgi:hypothetical protein
MAFSEEPDDFVESEIDEDIDYDGSEEGSRAVEEEEILPAESIVRQNLQMLRERLEEPEVFYPARDYSQKNDAEEDVENPNIQHAMMRLSLRAQEAYKSWLGSIQEMIPQMLLDPVELTQYEEHLTLAKEEEQEYKLALETKHTRACSETVGFLHTQVSNLAYNVHNVSFEDSQFNRVLCDYQTNIWRKPYSRPEGDFGFLDPKHDPDFLNPLSVSKGFLFRPAFRPYNLTFEVVYDYNSQRHTKIIKPSSAKDYNTVEDITYLVTSKGGLPVSVKSITPEKEIKWEIDLRICQRNGKVDGKESLVPDARNYKKINTASKVGRRLLRSLRENPYHEWQEVSWEFGTERKTAMIRVAKQHLVWCYVDQKSLSKRKNRTTIVFPQTVAIQQRSVNNALFTIGYTIRYSDYKELDKPFDFLVKRELDTILARLGSEGFAIVHKSGHDLMGAVELTLLHEKMKTGKARYLARTE